MSDVIYMYRRKGQDSWATCDKSRYLELGGSHLFEVRVTPSARAYAALEAECERLRELLKESERHLHHWQGQAAAKGRNVVSMEKERDTLRAELAALKAPAVAGGEREARHDEVMAIHNVLAAVPCASLYSMAEAIVDAGYTRHAQTEQPALYVSEAAFADPEQIGMHATRAPNAVQNMGVYAAPIAQTPADQPSDCEWCAGARHDYYGEKCQHCAAPADGLVEALVKALESSPHGLHKFEEGGCSCSQCEFVRLRDAALAAHRAGQAQIQLGEKTCE